MTQVITLQAGGSGSDVRRDWSPIAQPPDRNGIIAHTPNPGGYHDMGGRTMLPRHTQFGGSKGFDTRPGIVNVDPADPVRGEGGVTVDLELVSKEAFIRAAEFSGGDPIAAWDLAAQAQIGGPGVVQLAPGQPQAAAPISPAPLQQPTIGAAAVPVTNMYEALQQPTQSDAGGTYVQMAPGAAAPGYVVPHTNPSGGVIPRENANMSNPIGPGGGLMPAAGMATLTNPNVKQKEAGVNTHAEQSPWEGAAASPPAGAPVLQPPGQPGAQMPVATPPGHPVVPGPVQYAAPPGWTPPAQHAPMPTQVPAPAPAPVTMVPVPMAVGPPTPLATGEPAPQVGVDAVQHAMLEALKELGDQVKSLQNGRGAAPSDWELTKQGAPGQAESQEETLPEGVEYADTHSCGLGFLTNPPSRPRIEVIFDLGVGGLHTKRFHWAAFRNGCLSLFFDTRSDYDQFVPPETLEDSHTIGVRIPSRQLDVRVKCFHNNHQRFGCVDQLNFTVWTTPVEVDHGPPIATHDTLQELHTLGGMAEELSEGGGWG